MDNWEKDIELAQYTTFKIGGKADYFYRVKSVDDLIESIKSAKKENLPFFILGSGSNLLVSDEGFRGLVIKMEYGFIEKPTESEIIAGAGMLLSTLLFESIKYNLSGLEWAIGIPGTVGGAICGNSGAFGQSTSNSVKSVEILDTETMEVENKIFEFCDFKYRRSIFKNNNRYIILSAAFEFQKNNKEEIDKNIKEYISQRQKNNPIGPSAGCVFRNIQKGEEKISVGKIIEACRLKGKIIGGAQISDKHANFIVNINNAKAKDVLDLIDLAKKTVKLQEGFDIEEEIVILK
ncbi:MAG TPA: UDP-N-acetylmuramate dehydrogenase [Candidatus Paceibacterota bacterium]|nr:UDP-N-acetylmuramate dehydrogenase [Candidatus Paceibacterota bacterium]